MAREKKPKTKEPQKATIHANKTIKPKVTKKEHAKRTANRRAKDIERIMKCDMTDFTGMLGLENDTNKEEADKAFRKLCVVLQCAIKEDPKARPAYDSKLEGTATKAISHILCRTTPSSSGSKCVK